MGVLSLTVLSLVHVLTVHKFPAESPQVTEQQTSGRSIGFEVGDRIKKTQNQYPTTSGGIVAVKLVGPGCSLLHRYQFNLS